MTNPTKEMLSAGMKHMPNFLSIGESELQECLSEAFKAMVAAAPVSQTKVVPVEPFQEGSQSLNELRRIFDILDSAPELNPSNYDHEGVCELNARTVEAYLAMRDLLRALPAPPASILGDLEGLQRFPVESGVEVINARELDAIIEKHRSG